MSKKVAFVTPRYGPQVMGGAESAVRQLAEHLRALTDWEAEVHTTCALDAITWADVLDPGTTVVNGVTVHRHPSAQGRLPDFYGLDGLVRLAPRLATREQGKRWVDYNGPVSPQLVDAVVRVGRRCCRLLSVPVPPDGGDHRQGRSAGGVPPGRTR